MISVIGSTPFGDFVNLNKGLLEKIFGSNVLKTKINLFVINNEGVIDSSKKNKKNEDDVIIYIVNKVNKKNINKEYLISTIFYPIKPHEFLSSIESITIAQLLKKYGLLVENNVVTNLKNDKKIGLTNTEMQILNLLVLCSRVERKFLEKKVLNFKNEISSNSLDSHLVRLRKKIRQLNENIEITSKESKHININLST